MKKPYLIALILTLPFISAFGQDETLYPWTDIQGRTLQASFISYDDVAQTVTIKWNGNIFPLPLNTLSVPSQQLAKQLGAPAPTPPSQSSSSPFDEVVAAMPTDALGPEALDIEHDWSSADGRPLAAKFISLVGDQLTIAMNGGEKEFTLPLSKFSDESQALAVNLRGRPTKIPWSKLDAQSVALGKALQKLKKSLVPTIHGGTEKNLERYGSGKWKNYNTYIESVAFEAGILSNGTEMHIWLIKDGQRVQSRPFSASFEGTFKDERGSLGHRKVISLDSSPPASNDRRITTIKGKWNNEGTFEYFFEMSGSGLSFWGEAKEPKSTEHPSTLRVTFRSPSIVVDAKNATMEEIKKVSGDGALYVDPLQEKRIKFPFDEKWTDIKNKLAARSKDKVEYNPIKYAEFNGFPFGDHKIKIQPSSTRTASLVWFVRYGVIFPSQGSSLIHRSTDGAQAMDDYKNAGDYKNRLKIKKSESLKVQVIRGS
jgi:hypothetical protein